MNRSKTQSIHVHQLIEGLRRAQTGESLPRPQGGWLRAVRQATGLSLKSVAGQLNVSPQAVHQLEKSEAAATVSLKQLSAAAAAMGCRLEYSIVPLQETLAEWVAAARPTDSPAAPEPDGATPGFPR